VWLQANAQGEVYAPFRLDLRESCHTWLGCLPHSWGDQVDAANGGRHDRWLTAKAVGGRIKGLPLTLGYNTRADIPFYYALADAFTVCDQHFCSTLTGTTPNRLHFWTGTIRAEQNAESKPHVYNSDTDHLGKLTWRTFPERLSELGVSWKVYQNELTTPSGMTDAESNYLGNFGDNPLEYFAQYHPHFSAGHRAHLAAQLELQAKDVAAAEAEAAKAPLDNDKADKAGKAAAERLEKARKRLEQTKLEAARWSQERWEAVPARERELHERGLVTNRTQADFHQLSTLVRRDAGGKPQNVSIPKGDVFHQFREDVAGGRLPTVSWLVAPRYFSDHPDSPWFGAWYVSETLHILSQNPEVWKKTIFVLTYDENDGFFDHAPPFRAPAPAVPQSGFCSQGIDPALEHTTRDRNSSLGLGFRVPLVVASPWSRGGWVNSQVFDHTSALRFLEQFVGHKIGKPLHEPNINAWRRTVCGDLTSIFRPFDGEKPAWPTFLEQQAWVEAIHGARGKPLPDAGKPLTPEEIAAAVREPSKAARLPRQEPGTRPSCALPYELRADGAMSKDGVLTIKLAAGAKLFGAASAGAPFQVYAPGKSKPVLPDKSPTPWVEYRVWNYAVEAGESLTPTWQLDSFEGEKYWLRVYGPNGFYRELMGVAADPRVAVGVAAEVGADGQATGKLRAVLSLEADSQPCTVKLTGNAYGHAAAVRKLTPERVEEFVLPLVESFGWYDFTLTIDGAADFSRRYAGRMETGRPLRSDPVMGGQA
jgi:phospholipase C